MAVPYIAVSREPFGGRILGPVRLSYTPDTVSNDQEHHLRIPDRRSAAGMVMRGAKPVQRMPEAKLLGASRVSRSRMAMPAASIADAVTMTRQTSSP